MLSRALPVLIAALALSAPAPPRVARFAPAPLRVLLVGGGPDLQHNQVAIESNVRYLERILPPDSSRRVLFADGRRESRTVLYKDSGNRDTYRRTQIGDLDGPARLDSVRTELSSMAARLSETPTDPVLLYFTGHGSPDEGHYENNRYDLWGSGELTVHDLARSIQAFPPANPVVLVMVECFSGAFGNVIFQDGDPKAPLSDHPICGFFASVPQRMAAGCTPNVNEEDYRDFTGYFFAALSGTDRLGRAVVGADYNHDGRVGMDEAFAYTLLHDDSIDTPVCTSDVFLRRFVTTPDPQVFQNSYRDVLRWATPCQHAALEGLSARLRYTGDGRLADAYDDFSKTNSLSESDRATRLIRFVRLAKSVILAHQLRASGDEGTKRRFESLLRQESANPLKD